MLMKHPDDDELCHYWLTLLSYRGSYEIYEMFQKARGDFDFTRVPYGVCSLSPSVMHTVTYYFFSDIICGEEDVIWTKARHGPIVALCRRICSITKFPIQSAHTILEEFLKAHPNLSYSLQSWYILYKLQQLKRNINPTEYLHLIEMWLEGRRRPIVLTESNACEWWLVIRWFLCETVQCDPSLLAVLRNKTIQWDAFSTATYLSKNHADLLKRSPSLYCVKFQFPKPFMTDFYETYRKKIPIDVEFAKLLVSEFMQNKYIQMCGILDPDELAIHLTTGSTFLNSVYCRLRRCFSYFCFSVAVCWWFFGSTRRAFSYINQTIKTHAPLSDSFTSVDKWLLFHISVVLYQLKKRLYVTLSTDIIEKQIEALVSRSLGDPEVAAVARLIYICPCCNDIHSPISSFANRKERTYHPKSISGINSMVIDIKTDDAFCARKTGNKTKYCRKTKLIKIDLLGRLLYVNGRAITICCECGILFSLEHTQSNQMMCHRCCAEVLKPNKKRKLVE